MKFPLIPRIAALLLCGTLTAAQADVNVGVTLSLTGPGASLGIPSHNAIKLFPKDINGEKINSPHRPALDALATHLTLNAEHLGDALEDPSFLALLAALVNSGYWFFED